MKRSQLKETPKSMDSKNPKSLERQYDKLVSRGRKLPGVADLMSLYESLAKLQAAARDARTSTELAKLGSTTVTTSQLI